MDGDVFIREPDVTAEELKARVAALAEVSKRRRPRPLPPDIPPETRFKDP